MLKSFCFWEYGIWGFWSTGREWRKGVGVGYFGGVVFDRELGVPWGGSEFFFFFLAVVFTIFFVRGMYVSATFFFLSFKINLFFRVSASLLVII